MAAITEAQLADGLEAIYDQWSDDPDIDVKVARRKIAEEQAKLIAQFVQGRTTTGTSSDGASVTTTIN